MHIESSVTSISWIPSEAVKGTTKLPFEMGLAHYDDPPPDHVESLAELREADRFRFANQLSAWIEVDNGRIVDRGQGGGGQIGSTTIRLGGRGMTFAAVAFPDKRPVPVTGDGWVRFTQGKWPTFMPGRRRGMRRRVTTTRRSATPGDRATSSA